MTVRGAGQTQVATRPGSMIVTNLGSPPGMPTLLAQGALNAQLGALEGRRAPQGSGGGGGGGRNADQVAQSSGLLGRQFQPVGAHRGAGRAGQLRFRPGPAQSQSQRHDRHGAVQREPWRAATTSRVQDQQRSRQPAAGGNAGAAVCRHRRRQMPTSSLDGRRNAADDPTRQPSQPAADGNRDLRRRHGRRSRTAIRRYRQLSECLELRPRAAATSPQRSTADASRAGTFARQQRDISTPTAQWQSSNTTRQLEAERRLLRATQPA